MIDPHNPDYGVSKLYALRAYFTNALNFDGLSTRSEYWWLLPWLLLFEVTSAALIGNRILPQLTLRAFLIIPSTAICARRYRDVGLLPSIGIAQTIFAYSTWWLMYANASGKVADGILWGWLALWVVSQIAKLVITLMPTQQATTVVTQSQAIAEYRAAHHLSVDELKLFRETMSTAKQQILTLGTQAQRSEALAKIFQTTGGLHAAQELFRELMAHPHVMNEHGDFLYKMLPALVESCDQFITAEQADVENEAVNAAITEMAVGIQQQSIAIANDYAQVVTTDAEEVRTHG
ncbi:5-bromo-4-chloroindolyl phosphate hydrolysis family protein [Lacticaseibacillus porcinae]|uniref:5-bromo-4-chloroindolyl phosphate hydrolysis family protein n=1 Tax=Lacticaseibacillus porcinae TaxID=1123687 RepID=UPI000F78C7D5|nr:5-bromo-4-chloroindolyl phosphate hydrolysis family protein [Lacticaseibacillus porcinae]